MNPHGLRCYDCGSREHLTPDGPNDYCPGVDWEQRARDLALAVLAISKYAMPESYFQTDARVQLARRTLNEH